jgi:very-short-patch-repair endonuclease
MSLPEVLLWQDLRRSALASARFRRQHSIGPYILDFFCAAARLAVEIDGASHDHPEQAAHDQARDKCLTAQGITVLRVEAKTILHDADRADFLHELTKILAAR